MIPLVVNPLAEQDIADAKDWYERQKPGLGNKFLNGVQLTLVRIQQMPQLYAVAFENLRLALVRRFPYAVIYRIDDDQITVIAVYHTSRNPRGWQRRA